MDTSSSLLEYPSQANGNASDGDDEINCNNDDVGVNLGKV